MNKQELNQIIKDTLTSIDKDSPLLRTPVRNGGGHDRYLRLSGLGRFWAFVAVVFLLLGMYPEMTPSGRAAYLVFGVVMVLVAVAFFARADFVLCQRKHTAKPRMDLV